MTQATKLRILSLLFLLCHAVLAVGPGKCEYSALPSLSPEEMGARLDTLSRDRSLRAVLGITHSATPHIDFMVGEDGERFHAREILGSHLLEVSWTDEIGTTLLRLSAALNIASQVGEPVRKIEGYATDNLGRQVREGSFDTERWSRVFSRMRREKWTFQLEPRGARLYVVARLAP